MEDKTMMISVLNNIKNIISLLNNVILESDDYEMYLNSLNKYIKLYHKVSSEITRVENYKKIYN